MAGDSVDIRQYAYGICWPTFQIGPYTYFHSDLDLQTWSPGERIIIGKFCSIAERIVICTGGLRRTDLAALYPFDRDRAYRSTANTTIGHDVWIGSAATVLGGVTVGDGAVIGAGAVVNSDVPAFAVVAGNPAKVMRYRFSRPVVQRLLRIAWWHWPIEQIHANTDWFYRPIHEFLGRFDPTGEDDGHRGTDRDHP